MLTGHDNGLITINTNEADAAEREKLRSQISEAYRTVLGHFRHEVGHYYWDRLVRDGGWTDAFRNLFGTSGRTTARPCRRTTRTARGPTGRPPGLGLCDVHPWEDWAETFAHFLHVVDTLETARAFGLKISPRIRKEQELSTEVDFDPYRSPDIETLIGAWLPLTFAVNSLNRSMGQPDLYPFVLSPLAVQKLGFVREVVARARRG